MIKVYEVIERNCCHPLYDLVRTVATQRRCIHCGQLWEWYRAPGDIEADYHKVTEELKPRSK